MALYASVFLTLLWCQIGQDEEANVYGCTKTSSFYSPELILPASNYILSEEVLMFPNGTDILVSLPYDVSIAAATLLFDSICNTYNRTKYSLKRLFLVNEQTNTELHNNNGADGDDIYKNFQSSDDSCKNVRSDDNNVEDTSNDGSNQEPMKPNKISRKFDKQNIGFSDRVNKKSTNDNIFGSGSETTSDGSKELDEANSKKHVDKLNHGKHNLPDEKIIITKSSKASTFKNKSKMGKNDADVKQIHF